MTRSEAAIAALQDCLAIEHEAIWLYGYLGARIAAVEKRAVSAYAAHRRSRDALLALLHDASAEAPGPRTDYAIPAAKNTAQASTTARAIEAKAQAAYLGLVGASRPADRRFAITQLRKSAVDALGWGAEPSAFPGLPD